MALKLSEKNKFIPPSGGGGRDGREEGGKEKNFFLTFSFFFSLFPLHLYLVELFKEKILPGLWD